MQNPHVDERVETGSFGRVLLRKDLAARHDLVYQARAVVGNEQAQPPMGGRKGGGGLLEQVVEAEAGLCVKADMSVKFLDEE